MTARALADEGTAAVLAADTAAHRGYAARIKEAVDVLGICRVEFDAEMARAWVEVTYPDARPHSPNVYGAVFRELANAGRIVPVGWTEATRPESRGRALRVWQVVPTP